MRAIVDQDVCIGCGLCPQICPEVFKMIEDINKAVAYTDPVPDAAKDTCQEAADSCPVAAITIT